MGMTMRLAGEVKYSLVDGPGIRYVIFFQGCPHECVGCQNPNTHDLCGGYECAVDELIVRIQRTKFIDGITLSGGEPFLQSVACYAIANAAKELNLSVWAYTGWTFEHLLKIVPDVLKAIDILVDGPYVQALHSENCLWRGSTNQRLVDVQASLKSRKMVLWGDDIVSI